MKLLIIVLFVATATVCNARICPRFWHLYRGYCYRYYGDRVTWTQAEARCQEASPCGGGAHLASIHNQDENAFIYELFRSSAGDTPDWVYDEVRRNPFYGVWTGLHQAQTNGPWIWTDESDVDFTWWLPNEPNDSFYGEQAEDCVHIWRTSDSSDTIQRWNDVWCGIVQPFICKMSAVEE